MSPSTVQMIESQRTILILEKLAFILTVHYTLKLNYTCINRYGKHLLFFLSIFLNQLEDLDFLRFLLNYLDRFLVP